MTRRYRTWSTLGLCALTSALVACVPNARSQQAPPPGAEPWPFEAIDYGERDIEVRAVESTALEPFRVGAGPVAFVLSANIDGTITLFHSPDEVEAQALEFPKDLVRVLNAIPITILYYDQEENTHRCTGSTSGGDGTGFCPVH